jgi:tRNA(Leu) C34 or U34 (ribose-2'-O)-methylase TrmL
VVHASLESLRLHFERDGRPFAERARLFTARGGSSLFSTPFAADDILLFGSESKGLPPELLGELPSRRVYVPIRDGVRSLNLANVACLGVYTAMVSAGVPLPRNEGAYEPHELRALDIKPASRATRVDS